MQLNGYDVNINDRLYDISIQRGYGYVSKVTDNYIEVKFPKYSVRYNSEGIQLNKDWQTLFWDKPLIIDPEKDEREWSKKRQLIADFYQLVINYKGFV